VKAAEIFKQNDGEVTKAYYAELNGKGPLGELAVALFRAQKRSTAAKKYRRGKFRHAAYDVKNWSLSEVCRILDSMFTTEEFNWGWQEDQNTPGFSWVLYVDLPGFGQASFHSAERLKGPDFAGKWSGVHGESERAILGFCDIVMEPQMVMDDPSKRTPEEWYALIPKLAHWAFK
jgi:hypothetical protein